MNTESQLTIAACQGQFNKVKWYLKMGVNINHHHSEPLRWTFEQGQYQMVEFLLENGADVNQLNLCIDDRTEQPYHYYANQNLDFYLPLMKKYGFRRIKNMST